MTCKGICSRYQAFGMKNGGRYLDGQSRCDMCDGIWIRWDGLYCPCCSHKLRKKPRKSISKLNLRIKVEAMRINEIQGK